MKSSCQEWTRKWASTGPGISGSSNDYWGEGGGGDPRPGAQHTPDPGQLSSITMSHTSQPIKCWSPTQCIYLCKYCPVMGRSRNIMRGPTTICNCMHKKIISKDWSGPPPPLTFWIFPCGSLVATIVGLVPKGKLC